MNASKVAYRDKLMLVRHALVIPMQSIFTARCYASAVLAMGLCLCLSVSVCVCHKSEFY